MGSFKRRCTILLSGIFAIFLAVNILVELIPASKDFIYSFTRDLSSLLKNISLAYIGSYVFYIFQSLIPDIFKSRAEKKIVQTLLSSYYFDGFITVFVEYYNLPFSYKDIPNSCFLVLEKITATSYYTARILIQPNFKNKKHYIEIIPKKPFYKVSAEILEHMHNQIKTFLLRQQHVLCNDDLILCLKRIEENSHKLAEIYKDGEKYVKDNCILGGIDDLALMLYKDWTYIKSRYKITSSERLEVLKTKEEYAFAKKSYEEQLQKTFDDIKIATKNRKCRIEVNPDMPKYVAISRLFENLGYIVKSNSNIKSIHISSTKKDMRVFVFGRLNFNLFNLIMLKKNYDRSDIYWLERKIGNYQD